MPYLDSFNECTTQQSGIMCRGLSSLTKQHAQPSLKIRFEYWDGERQYGYGGYHYDGRWLPVAQKLLTHFDLKPGVSY